MNRKNLREGYHVFFAPNQEAQGMQGAALLLEEIIHAAEEEFDITFLSGPAIKDDQSSGREMYVAYQGAVLKRKAPDKGDMKKPPKASVPATSGHIAIGKGEMVKIQEDLKSGQAIK